MALSPSVASDSPASRRFRFIAPLLAALGLVAASVVPTIRGWKYQSIDQPCTARYVANYRLEEGALQIAPGTRRRRHSRVHKHQDDLDFVTRQPREGFTPERFSEDFWRSEILFLHSQAPRKIDAHLRAQIVLLESPG